MRATFVDDHVTIAVEGHLDASAGSQLVETVMASLADSPARVDIDLSVLDSFTSDGAAALSRCRDLCGHLRHGLHYRTEGGAGQLALLTAFEREPEVDALG